MEDSREETSKNDRSSLAERLIETGKLAFNPASDSLSRAKYEDEFNGIIQGTGTMTLLPALNILIQPGRVEPWFRTKLMAILTNIPLRKDGVRGTLEFVFSVHPSNVVGKSEEASTQKQGANITQEALNLATKLLGNPPAGMPATTWFSGIAPQLMGLLDGKDGFELIKVASYVIGFGILGRKQFGAPGAAGWKTFAEPLLTCINPSLGDQNIDTMARQNEESHAVVDLSKNPLVVSAQDLALALNRLQALLISHPNPGLSRRLLNPVLLSLWALASWPKQRETIENNFSLPARNLLSIYLKISSSADRLGAIVQDLPFNGDINFQNGAWMFEGTDAGGIQIVSPREGALASNDLTRIGLDQISSKADQLIGLIESVDLDSEDLSAVFISLFDKWMTARSSKKPESILLSHQEKEAGADSMVQLFEINMLEKMMQKFPEKLVSRPDRIIGLVARMLQEASESDDADSIPVSLSLLNLVFTTPNFRRKDVDQPALSSVEASLEKLARSGDAANADTARNLSLFIKYRDEIEDPTESVAQGPDKHTEDRKTHSLAMSYITQADAPAPVRAEGLNLIQSLVIANSPVLDIPAILVLMSSILEDNDDYINLRVIKIFTLLAEKHPKTVTKEILDRYIDTTERTSIDARLRFGEALLQVVERLGETFAGDIAQQIAEALLATAGRRGYRPKTAAKKERSDKLQQMKNKKAEEEWAGEVPALGDEITEEELEKNEVLKRLVEGWEGKSGAEDVRIRASALSILSTAIETNIGGIGPDLISAAVDLCISILTMEAENEKGILRRPAIVLVLAFVRALDDARQRKRQLGFGLTDESREDILRVLRYVAVTDGDGLVRQHAADVIESLENWRMVSVLPSQESELSSRAPLGLSRLAGLDINPSRSAETSSGSNSQQRPKIEEIE